MGKHWIENHPEMLDPPKFKFEVKRKCRSSLERQIWEALDIENENNDITMNSRGEWGINIVPKLKPTENGDLTSEGKGQGEIRSTKRKPDDAMLKTLPIAAFSGQYKQRKKRARMKKVKENGQTSEEASVGERIEIKVQLSELCRSSKTSK